MRLPTDPEPKKDCRVTIASSDIEWNAIKTFRQVYFFDKVNIADPYTWTFDHPDHVHFVLHQSQDIIGYAHAQLWGKDRAALRIIVIDETQWRHGFGRQLLTFIEKWLKYKGFKTLHVESRPDILSFYQNHGYVDMPFNDPDGYESCDQDIPVGKVL